MKIFGFSRAKHLVKTDEISSVFSFNSRFSSEHFHVLVKPTQSEFGRVAVIVSKKIASRATSRNYMKRLARERFRQQQHDLVGLDIVVRVRKSYAQADYKLVSAELLREFDRVRGRFPLPTH